MKLPLSPAARGEREEPEASVGVAGSAARATGSLGAAPRSNGSFPRAALRGRAGARAFAPLWRFARAAIASL